MSNGGVTGDYQVEIADDRGSIDEGPRLLIQFGKLHDVFPARLLIRRAVEPLQRDERDIGNCRKVRNLFNWEGSQVVSSMVGVSLPTDSDPCRRYFPKLFAPVFAAGVICS